MLSSEGYKMFRGTARIVPLTDRFAPYEVSGDWLYKPEWDCWYVNGSSYPAEIVKDIREESETMLMEALGAKISALSSVVVNDGNMEEVRAMCDDIKKWLVSVKVAG